MKIYIGIDPGVNGGIWVIHEGGPTYGQKCADTVADMTDLLRDCLTLGEVKVVIESVHSMPGQGVASTFKFGKNYGEWLGMLAAFQIPYVQVSPQKWMKHFGSLPAKKPGENAAKHKTRRKNHLKHLAQQRFPQQKIILATADAALLASYAREVAFK